MYTIPMVSRILVVIVILGVAALLMLPTEVNDEKPQVLGAETPAKLVYANEEIERLVKVLGERPDYAAAWLRLSILYEQIGESDLALEAREKARDLNPDF